MSVLDLLNRTPFSVAQFVSADCNGRELLLIVIKASYNLLPSGRIELSEEQIPIRTTDEYYGDPGHSSMKYEAETAIAKTRTDIVMIGHAFSERGKSKEVDVSLKVGRLKKVVRVFGDRYWHTRFGIDRISTPKAFDKLQLRYERAFGGRQLHGDKFIGDPRNPVGTGYYIKDASTGDQPSKLPNIEDPKNLISSRKDNPMPVGFGFISPHWAGRQQYGGTYDETWARTRMPLLPCDFDMRFYNAAHPNLILHEDLSGGEPVEIANASSRGVLRFPLPTFQLPKATLHLRTGKTIHLTGRLDTVVINTDEHKLFLIGRVSVDIHNSVHNVKELHVA